MYRITIRGRNCAKYIKRCIKKLHGLKCEDWIATISLDDPKDDSYEIAKKFESDKIKVHLQKKHIGLAHNMVKVIELAGPEDEDVIVVCDADDYLFPGALNELDRAYRDRDVLATYGSFMLECSGKKSRICKPYPKGANVRKYKWRATHLKSFKYKVFKAIPVEYFRHKGVWIPAASDVALMVPLMERAGMKHCKHLRKVLYFYNNSNKYSVNRGRQKRYERIIRSKKPLKRLF